MEYLAVVANTSRSAGLKRNETIESAPHVKLFTGSDLQKHIDRKFTNQYAYPCNTNLTENHNQYHFIYFESDTKDTNIETTCQKPTRSLT